MPETLRREGMLVAGRTFELYIPGVIRLGWVPRARLNIYQRRGARPCSLQ